MKKTFCITLVSVAVIVIITACSKSTQNVSSGKPIATTTINNLTVTLSNSTGQLKQGQQELMLAFTDASGNAVDVGAVSLNFHMPAMGSMVSMNDAVTLTTTNTPGVYNGKVNVPMAGEWQGQLAFEGSAGKG